MKSVPLPLTVVVLTTIIILGLVVFGFINSNQSTFGVSFKIFQPPQLTSVNLNLLQKSLNEITPSPKEILANQPDFIADELFFDNEGFGGFSGKTRIAKKGNRFFYGDDGDQNFNLITEIGKRISLDEVNKTFDETPSNKELTFGNGSLINLQLLAFYKDIRFITVGTQKVDEYDCLKIEVKRKGLTSKVFLYAAKELKYLIIKAEVKTQRRTSIQKLQNISLVIPNDSLGIPVDYKPIPKTKWKLVETAKVVYDRKLKRDSTVFRSDDGNQLYVTVYEPHPVTQSPYPWHYLIFFKEETTNIAYQGLLITKNGEVAWETKDREAISSGLEKPNEDHYPCEIKNCPKTTIGTNLVSFPSVDYKDNKKIIQITW